MSIHVALNHRTTYRYDRPVTLSPQIVRLRPAPHCRTTILSYSLRIEPEKHFLNWQQDPQGNYLARLVFPEKTSSFVVEVDLVAAMAVLNPFDFFLEASAEHVPFTYEPWLLKELRPFLETEPAGPLLQDWLRQTDRSKKQTVNFLVDLNLELHKRISYVIRMEPGVQSPEETIALGKGSCRDSAWLLVQMLRHLGFAARFVSGYLIQLKPDVKPLDGPAGAGEDFTDLHAWTEVYLPGAGWIGLDPTSGLLASEGHIPLACSPDPSSAAPIAGTVERCETVFDHSMSVTRIHESPRVTKPYTEEDWTRIHTLGLQVDDELRTGDVRLTMGGEPTFVSIDDMDGEEWNTAALGPRKRLLAGELIRRLKNRFSTGGLLHFGQGKWYPGESLPRWSFACYWRKDGQPLWTDESLYADEKKDYGMNAGDSRQFIHTLARRLGVDPRFSIPAYEDAWYYLWRERKLPSNVDPLRSNLHDPEERKRLARIFEQGLDKVIGHVLPLQRIAGPSGAAWQTGSWFLRPEHLFLLPGDSPIGYRLPLDSLPWVSATDYPYINELDPTAPRSPLPPHPGRQLSVPGRTGTGSTPIRTPAAPPSTRSPAAQESAHGIIRTAFCVEPRDGKLYLFMPPVQYLEDYLDLVTAIEDTSATLGLPVILEGYPPPHDSRLHVIKVTPDPGVIEVNVHPASNWSELVHLTTTLYEEARQTRLGTEKFMIDGRHTGTGGGNHIVIGGESPLDSPLLRRPDLLRSLLTCWHNHPSLSYLFSGLFIGPTSQAPRVDEARNDSVYELELAFKQLPDHTSVPPWLVDRVLRNLLIDATGNTHRSEFCIDKLYSPDSSSGRLGLLELRSFEMPPHPQMSLAQQLLLRTLIARFWKQPLHQKLMRWGTELHDRFMLPHFVRSDFEDVIADLRDAGYPMESRWFDPHFEFKFPLIGTVTHRDVELEIRQALEPWHVLGEESSAGGAVRYVDSSVERLQVRTRGLIHPRYRISCNGRPLPLHPTGTHGEFVAGVRYRAWRPASCLHPTIGLNTPLTFDLVDTWSGRSLGGCVYHVMHPGGRNYATLPVNAYEAESRRLARFFNIGHSPGRTDLPDPEILPEFPFTLDLRRG
jgi:uncharacterized protein (DUF2126 family)/transglutaminase-like putative cysteine protease